jgi:hypothetical protein
MRGQRDGGRLMEFVDRNFVAMLFGLSLLICGNNDLTKLGGMVVIVATTGLFLSGWQP